MTGPAQSAHIGTVAGLRSRLRGLVHDPGSEGYADTCTLFNSMVERRPALVVRCAATEDIVTGLAFAGEQGLEIAVRAGGHSVTGRSLCDDGLVLDLRDLCRVDVDPVRRVARVGGGATWAQLDRATQAHGLAVTGGRVSSTGVAGLTLGGGSGWLERKHGLTCDNLLAAELVTADGRVVRASEDQNPDLLWALRGGGGNFGVVTALELALHPVGPEVLAGLVLHPAEHATELLALFRDVMHDAPEGLGLAFDLTTAPDEPEVPEALRGKPAVLVAGMYAGDVAEGERVLAGLRAFGPPAADFFDVVGYTDFQCSIDDPPGYRNWWTEQHVAELPDGAIETIVEGAGDLPPGPSQIFIVPWGGAVARAPQGSTPLGGRDAKFIVHPLLLWEDPADDEADMAYGRAFRDAMEPWATGATYLNFMGDEGGHRLRAGFAPGDFERLQRVKAAWDPDSVFHGNQTIAPAAA